MSMDKSHIFLFLFLFTLFSVTTPQSKSILIKGLTSQDISDIDVPIWLNSSTSEYTRFLSDKYNYFITPRGNKMWVCSMNLAWNQMKRNFLQGKNATFLNTTQLQQQIIDNLNSQIFTKDQLSKDDYYIFSGYGQKTVDKINLDIRERFSSRTLPSLNYQLNDQDFISYAYLFKKFQFKVPFTHYPMFYFKDQSVNGFVAVSNKQKKQLYYKYYNSRKDFMIGIETKNPTDEIILWKTNMTDMKNMKIQKVLQMFNMFYNLPSQRLDSWDEFRMPVVTLDVKRSYKELLQLKFADKQHQDYVISKMDERISLKITRFGVELETEAQVQLMFTAIFGAKYFILNEDFWVILKEKNKQPYLVTLVSSVDQVWSE